MQQRLKKIDRIIKVQEHLHRAAELKLADLQRKAHDLRTAQQELIHTMSDDAALHGLFVDGIARRLKALALEEARIRSAIAAQQAVTVEAALQVRRSERISSRLNEDVRHFQEKKDLAAILEAAALKGCTSLP